MKVKREKEDSHGAVFILNVMPFCQHGKKRRSIPLLETYSLEISQPFKSLSYSTLTVIIYLMMTV